MKIQELERLIKRLVKNKELTNRERNSLASNIKKQYGITMKDIRYKGREITIRNLRKLISPLIENYDLIKDLNSINETLQTMAQDYDTAYIPDERNKKSIEQEKEKIYTSILGNPGTTVDGMSSEYISKIIKIKLTKEEGINRDDIINVLNMQSKNMYLDIEEYQNLINNSIISYLTSDPKGTRFTNAKILSIFQSLASSYKIQENYDKVKEIYEKALKIKTLENTDEYRDIQTNYERFLDFMEMKSNFEDRRFDSFDDLINSLQTEFTKDEIFIPGTLDSDIKQQSTQAPTSSNSTYVMPVKKKLEGFKRLVKALKRENEDYDISKCEVGRDAYDGYVIFKIDNTNISIFENFNPVNARIFVVKNEMIDSIKTLAKNEAITLDGVEGTNHVQNFENYCKNLIERTQKLIRETQIGIEPPEKDEILFDDNIQESVDFQNIPKTSVQKEREGENDENTALNKVELERRKALINREKLKKLEERLIEIQKETDEKIADVQDQDEHTQD